VTLTCAWLGFEAGQISAFIRWRLLCGGIAYVNIGASTRFARHSLFLPVLKGFVSRQQELPEHFNGMPRPSSAMQYETEGLRRGGYDQHFGFSCF
jgi:hypothetical protein